MTYQDVLLDVSRGVATITINRADRRNAMREKTITEMADILDAANDDDHIGVVVITGAGDKAFSGGGDLTNVADADGRIVPQPPKLDSVLRWVTSFRNCGKPIIAKVRGYCIGMGNELNLLCDLTVAGESAKFGQAGPRVGSVPIVGGTQLLPLVAGFKRAKEIMFLCRLYSGQAAVEMGLANLVVADDQLDDEVARWCEELLTMSPQSLRIAKLSMSTMLDLQWPAMQHGLELLRWFTKSDEMVEGAAAFLAKRPPRFRPALDDGD